MREIDIKKRIKELKAVLAEYGRISCISNDLEFTDFDESFYSNDLYIYRDTDKFVYLHDDRDNTDGKLTVENLKVILESIATREIEEKYELVELDEFLSSEDDE